VLEASSEAMAQERSSWCWRTNSHRNPKFRKGNEDLRNQRFSIGFSWSAIDDMRIQGV